MSKTYTANPMAIMANPVNKVRINADFTICFAVKPDGTRYGFQVKAILDSIMFNFGNQPGVLPSQLTEEPTFSHVRFYGRWDAYMFYTMFQRVKALAEANNLSIGCSPNFYPVLTSIVGTVQQPIVLDGEDSNVPQAVVDPETDPESEDEDELMPPYVFFVKPREGMRKSASIGLNYRRACEYADMYATRTQIYAYKELARQQAKEFANQ